MNTVTNYISQMINIMDIVTAEYTENAKQLSELDLLTQDLLHAIEDLPFDLEQGYQFALNIKDIRTRRRVVKNRLELLQIVVSNVQNAHLDVVRKKLDKKIKAQSEYVFVSKLMDADLGSLPQPGVVYEEAISGEGEVLQS